MFLKGIRECSLDLTLCLFPITFTDIDKQFTKFLSTTDPVDTGHKLNVHRTFRKRPGCLLNVLCTFNYVLYLLEQYHCDVYSSLVLTAKPFTLFLTLCDMLLTHFSHLPLSTLFIKGFISHGLSYDSYPIQPFSSRRVEIKCSI